MQSVRLLWCSLRLFFVGIKLDILNYAVTKYANSLLKKQKPLSDKLIVFMSLKFEHNAKIWKKEKKRFGILSEGMKSR